MRVFRAALEDTENFEIGKLPHEVADAAGGGTNMMSWSLSVVTAPKSRERLVKRGRPEGASFPSAWRQQGFGARADVL